MKRIKLLSLIGLALFSSPARATQHDYTIADGTGTAVLSDMNDAFQAQASTNKGNSAPSTLYTGQLWLDGDTPSGTTWTLNMYDGTDSISLGQINTTANTFAATGAQVSDSTLTSLAAYNTNGLLTQTAADTFTGRTITGTTGQISVSNGSGVSGNPTISLPGAVQFGASQTLTGARSFIGGGISNTLSTSDSAIIACDACELLNSDYSAILSGKNHLIDSLGDNNAIIAGEGNTINGDAIYTTAIGSFHILTTGSYNSLAIGSEGMTNRFGQFVHASGAFSAEGDAQTSEYVVRNSTTNNTQTELFLDGSSLRITIAADTTYVFEALISARRTDADNESGGYKITGVIDNNAGTTALVGSVTVTTIAEDNAGWDCTAQADNTNDALAIKCTGENAKTIRWVGSVKVTEVKG